MSVAFLITELVEYAMFRGAPFGLDLACAAPARRHRDSDRRIRQPARRRAERRCRFPTRFERIVTGLSRQLRSTIDRDQEAGRYAIDIAVVGSAPPD